MDDKERYQQGLEVRRAVLGQEHVDRSLSRLTDFSEDFQSLITRYAWGEIWTRPQLSRPTRSMLTLAMMVALHYEQEFKMHIAAAIRNGVTRDQIQEVLLQTAIYCGVPAANNAFHWAESAFADLDAKLGLELDTNVGSKPAAEPADAAQNEKEDRGEEA